MSDTALIRIVLGQKGRAIHIARASTPDRPLCGSNSGRNRVRILEAVRVNDEPTCKRCLRSGSSR